MGRRLSAAELKDRAELAAAREAEMKKRRADNATTNSTATKREDTVAVYYKDPLEKGARTFLINVPKSNILCLAEATSGEGTQGITRAGLRTDIPDTEEFIEIGKNSKIPIVRLNWYKGDNQVSKVVTPWKSIWYKRWDNQTINGIQRSHFSIPFSIATGTIGLNEVTDRFYTLFGTGTGNIKADILGDLGEATLTLGYGNQVTTLARAK